MLLLREKNVFPTKEPNKVQRVRNQVQSKELTMEQQAVTLQGTNKKQPTEDKVPRAKDASGELRTEKANGVNSIKVFNAQEAKTLR